MQVSAQFLEILRSRLTASQVIGKKVRLHAKGKEFHGLCPFHNEKTPSFTVNDHKGFYHCFGCGAHGDIVRFTMELSHLSFIEAVTALAAEAGIKMPRYDRQEAAKEQQALGLYEVMQQAAKWFQAQLYAPSGRRAQEYLALRGIKKEMLDRFQLGYAPGGRGQLKAFMQQKGVHEQLLIETGLLGKSDQGENYDRFRNRVIFPITDSRQRVIAFGGRILDEGQPKYLNSPETPLFKKGQTLYAEGLAREKALSTGEVVIAEGYMDVITLHQAGITNAVAPLGTAVTEEQLKRLWRLSKEPVFCLDGDTAGKNAMQKAALLALPLLIPGHSLRFAFMPAGKDPDEIIRQQGKEVMGKLLASGDSLSTYLWKQFAEHREEATPEEKAKAEAGLFALADQVADPTVRSYYRRFFKEKLDEQRRSSFFRGREFTQVSPRTSSVEWLALDNLSQVMRCQYSLLALLIEYPILLTDSQLIQDVIRVEWKDIRQEALCQSILDCTEMLENHPKSEEMPSEIKSILEKKGFSHDINYLCGENSAFINTVTRLSPAEVKHIWLLTLWKYHLAVMEEQKKLAEQETAEEALERVMELQKHIDRLRHQIYQKEQQLHE